MTAGVVESASGGPHAVDINVAGMTCTSCSNRVQRKLNKLPGVVSAVNFATEQAHVSYDPTLVDVPQLMAAISAAGYEPSLPSSDAGAGAGGADGAGRLGIQAGTALAVGTLVMAVSMVGALQFPGWEWVAFLATFAVYLFSGMPFHRAAVKNLRHGAFTMDTLISLGTTSALVWPLFMLLFGSVGSGGHVGHGSSGHMFLDTVGMVIGFLLVGRILEERAKKRARSALQALAQATPATVTRADGTVVATAAVAPGTLIVAGPGQTIALDGTVTAGRSDVDESMLTGEATPVLKNPGDAVYGGSQVTSGHLTIETTAYASDSTLAQMAQLVATAQAQKAPVQRLVDRITQYFVPAVIGIAVVTFLIGYFVVWDSAFKAASAAIAVLIVACPCALGLATPMALLVGTSRGAQLGLLIAGPQVLEATRKVDAILFDKTGTLTAPMLGVKASSQEALALAASVEAFSTHPIGRSIVAAYSGPVAEVTGFEEIPGAGVTGLLPSGERVSVAALPDDSGATRVGVWRSAGAVDFASAVTGEPVGTLSLVSQLKSSSAAAVAELKRRGITPYLLTGDSPAAALKVADEVGIERSHVIAEATPAAKLAAVQQLQAEGHFVAMVGDGLNDAAALAQADLGIAMATGTDVAAAAADITLTNSDPYAVVSALDLSQATLRNIRGNLFWAFGYNVALIPLAAAGVLPPMAAGLAMAASSVFVVGNSLRLRRFAG